MDVQSFHDPTTGTFTHLLIDTSSSSAAIIDPVLSYDPASGRTSTAHAQSVLNAAAASGLDVTLILETHAHADHLTASVYCKEQTGAPIAIGVGIRRVQATFRDLFHLGPDLPVDGRQFDMLYVDGETFHVGELEVRVMSTPGHTNDSNTYIVRGAAFVGDTLFRPDYGSARCDFPGGSAELLYDSVQKIHALPDGTRLYLCHDYPSEGQEPRGVVPVEESRAKNIHLRAGISKEEFVAMREARDAKLAVPTLILPSLQVNIRAGQLPPPESNGISYINIPVDQDLSQLKPAKDPLS